MLTDLLKRILVWYSLIQYFEIISQPQSFDRKKQRLYLDEWFEADGEHFGGGLPNESNGQVITFGISKKLLAISLVKALVADREGRGDGEIPMRLHSKWWHGNVVQG